MSNRLSAPLASPRLRSLLAGRGDADEPADDERCELCSAPLPASHRHLVELRSRELMCVCRGCAVLFDRHGAGAGRYRLVGDRRLALPDVTVPDHTWEQLRVPVDIAFLFHSSAAGRVVAYYPSPLGPTESSLELDAWAALVGSTPLLGAMEPDVEALLVNRARGARRAWLVPIDDCYRLVAVVRTHWRGFSGGSDVWRELQRFFDELDRRSRQAPAPGDGHRLAPALSSPASAGSQPKEMMRP